MTEINSPPENDLALTALRYAAGELSHPDSEAFAARIAEDQSAREALSEAIRLSAAALGQSPPTPDLLIRDAVRDQVWPGPVSRVFPRRPYRGHPAAWAGLGGFTAAGLTVFAVWLGDQPATPFHQLPAESPSIVQQSSDTIASEHPTLPTVVVIHETDVGPTVIVEAPESTAPLGTTVVATTVSDSTNDNTILNSDSESTNEPKAAVPIESSSAAQ